MGKPVTPVVVWSNSGNFPAGANLWNGQPLALIPAGTRFTPNTKPAAEEFNWLFGNIAAEVTALDQWVSTAPALNWPALDTTDWASDNINTGAYDAKFDRWLVGTSVSGMSCQHPWASQNGGYTWSAVGGAGNFAQVYPLQFIASNPTTGDILCCQTNPATANYSNYWTAGSPGTWSIDTNPQVSYPQASAAKWFAPASGYVVFRGVSGGSQAFVRAAGSAGTWTSYALPAPISTSTLASGAGPVMAQSPTRLLVGLAGGGVSGKSYMASTDDGITWTDRSTAAIQGHILNSLSYDTSNGLFVALSTLSASPVYTSPDTITWTAAAGTFPSGYTPQSLACLGALWVVVCNAAPAGSAQQCALYSIDQGATWHHCSGYRLPVTAGSGVVDTVLSSGQGFLAFNSEATNASSMLGVSPAA